MKKFIQTLGLSLMPWLCFAQLSGTVTDAGTKEKLPGAVVTIENTFLSTITDGDGKFSFENLNQNSEKITVTCLGYEAFSKEISLPDAKAEISLQPKSYLTEEVVVTATRASEKSPTAFTNLTGEEIQKNNLGQDLPYLLNTTPSVVVTSDAGTGIGYTGIRIRGSDATRVNVTINGIPVNDAESQQMYWVDLPDIASSVDNIQIQRGIGTSTNGAGAFGASVNLQTTTMSAEPFGAISSSYGSFNTWKNTASFSTGLMKNKSAPASGGFAFDGRLSKITSDGYIDHGTSDLKSFYLSGGYYGSKSTLRTVIFSGAEKTYQAWYGVPEDSLQTNRTYNPAGEYYDEAGNVQYYKNQTDNYQQDNYQLLYSYAANAKLNLNAALHYTKGKGYYEEYRAGDALSSYGLDAAVINNDTITSTDLIRQRWLDNDFYGFTFAANYETEKLQVTFGGAGNQYKGDHYDEVIWMKAFSPSTHPYVYEQNSAEKNDFDAYVKAIYSVNSSVHLYGDVQYRALQYSFLGLNEEMMNHREVVKLNFFNPKAGITLDVTPKSKIYASVAVGNREPVRDDYVQSSPASRPKPEQMTDFEAGYKYATSKVQAGVNIYNMNYKDQLILTGKINDVGAYTRQNVDQSYRRGIELEAGMTILRDLKASANITLSENKIKVFNEYVDSSDDAGNYTQTLIVHDKSDIAFSPSVITALVVDYSPVKNLTLEFVGKNVGKQYLDNTSDETRKLDAYNTVDLRINYHIKTSLFKDLELKLAISNLFDSKYSSNGYTYSYYYNGVLYAPNYYFPQAGTSWMGGVNVKF